MSTTPPVGEMIRQAIEELGGSATNAEIRETVLHHYPIVNPNTVNAQISICTVNSPSRIHYPENTKPRVASDPRYDFLYRVDWGRVDLYDPANHGRWAIVKDADGRLRVTLTNDAGTEEGTEPDVDSDVDENGTTQAQFLFGLERHLRDFLAANLSSLDLPNKPLSIFADDNGQSGVEYRTAVGPIDILALDANDDFVIFELKLGRGPDAAIGQLARYMGWVKQNLASDHAVRGVIIAKTVDEKLRYAASVLPNVSLYEYTMSFTLRPAVDIREQPAPFRDL